MTHPSVLIVGAGSDIAQAVAHCFAGDGYTVRLAARSSERFSTLKSDIALRHGVDVSLHDLDVLDLDAVGAFPRSFSDLPDVVVCAVGWMPDQSSSEQDLEQAARVLRSNFEGPSLLLGEFANLFEERGSGALVGISSVAGDRGRATNYVYGAAKAGFTAFLSGLRNRLAKQGVHVVTVLPGFVRTAMTEDLDLPAKLTADPDEVGQAVLRAVQKQRNIIYVRRIWWLIMLIIRNIPEGIFKKLKI